MHISKKTKQKRIILNVDICASIESEEAARRSGDSRAVLWNSE